MNDFENLQRVRLILLISVTNWTVRSGIQFAYQRVDILHREAVGLDTTFNLGQLLEDELPQLLSFIFHNLFALTRYF